MIGKKIKIKKMIILFFIFICKKYISKISIIIFVNRVVLDWKDQIKEPVKIINKYNKATFV